jgi:cytidine deaminase
MKEHELLIKYSELSIDELAASDKKLIDIAVESAKNAYAPYSKFRVGASVLLNDGTVIRGNNQENAAYPSGLCAERVAMFYANANYPNTSVNALAIVVINPEDEIIDENIAPCGSCRQVISETEMRFKKPVRILLVSKNSVLVFNSIEDLLPLSFNQGDLAMS